MNNSQTKQRLAYVDAAKGIGIILVCIGHSITNASASRDSSMIFLLKFITQFHMPMFFILSGMVYSEKYIEHPIQSSIKKFKVYYLPFIAYNLVFVVLHNVMVDMYIFSDAYSVKQYIKEILRVLTMHITDICGAMWFLRALLEIVVTFIWIQYLSIKVFGSKYIQVCTAIIVCMMTLFYYSRFCPTTFGINHVLRYMQFFYLGYLLRKYDWLKVIRKNQILCILAGIITGILAAVFLPFGYGRYIQFYLFYIIVAISGSFMVIAISQISCVEKNRILNILGRKSLDIMALHFVCFKIVSYLIICVYHLDMTAMANIPVVFGIEGAWWILYTLVGLVIPVVIRSIYDVVRLKIKEIRK